MIFQSISGECVCERLSSAGFEPATPGLEVRCAIRCATRMEATQLRRDSNPQPPDSKSDTLSIAPRSLIDSGCGTVVGRGVHDVGLALLGLGVREGDHRELEVEVAVLVRLVGVGLACGRGGGVRACVTARARVSASSGVPGGHRACVLPTGAAAGRRRARGFHA